MLAGYRTSQLAARAAGRLQRRRPDPLELPQDAPPLDDEAVRRLGGTALADLRDDEKADPAAPVLVAGVEVDPERPWQPAPGATGLSAFTLHYHAWLVPLAAGGDEARRRAWSALSDWLAAFPPTRAALDLAWHPYVVSTRVRAWSALLAAEPPPDLSLALAQALWQGLVLVEAHPERDVAGNHLLRNETALAAGAALFAGAEARTLQRGAEQRVLRLLQDQFRPDGGHVERSTAYQAEAANDLLDVYAASHDPLETEPAANAAEAAIGWLAHVSPAYQPRPALNDAPPELGPSTASLLERAAALGLEPFLRPARQDRAALRRARRRAHAPARGLRPALAARPAVPRARGQPRHPRHGRRRAGDRRARHRHVRGGARPGVVALDGGALDRGAGGPGHERGPRRLPRGPARAHDGHRPRPRRRAGPPRRRGPPAARRRPPRPRRRPGVVDGVGRTRRAGQRRGPLPPAARRAGRARRPGRPASASTGSRSTSSFRDAATVALTETPHAVALERVVPAPTIDVTFAGDVLETRIRATSRVAVRVHERIRSAGAAGSRLLDLVLVLVTGIAVGLAVASAASQHSTRADGRRLHAASTPRTSRRSTPSRGSSPTTTCRSCCTRSTTRRTAGLARVEWYDGAWAPLAPGAGRTSRCTPTASARVRRCSAGRSGRQRDAAGQRSCGSASSESGAVRLEIRVERADAGFAIPEASADVPIADGLLVTEWE